MYNAVSDTTPLSAESSPTDLTTVRFLSSMAPLMFADFHWSVTEAGLKLEISDLKKKRNCTIHLAKTKTLISFAVTAKLICAYVFAKAKIFVKCIFDSHTFTFPKCTMLCLTQLLLVLKDLPQISQL